MKKTILSIALLLSVISSLSSCRVQERHPRRYHRGSDRHHGPYDSNGYRSHRW